MSGTSAGGKKAAAKNIQKYGPNFYRTIGRMGGERGTTGGFGSQLVDSNGHTGRDRARLHGAKGGSISRRGSQHDKYIS